MANPSFHSFQRAFSRREFFRGRSLYAMIAAVIGTLFLAAALIDFYWIVDLLHNPFRSRPAVVASESDTSEESQSDQDQSADETDPANSEIDDQDEAANGNEQPSEESAKSKKKGKTEKKKQAKKTPPEPRVFWAAELLTQTRRILGWQDSRKTFFACVGAGVVLVFLGLFFFSLSVRWSSQVGMEVAIRLRKSLHRHALRLGSSDVDDSHRDEAMDLFTTEVDRVRHGVTALIDFCGRVPAQLAVLVLLAFSIDWMIALQCLVPIGFWLYLWRGTYRRSSTALRHVDSRTEHELKLLAEGFHKTRLVIGYAMESFEHDQFQKHLDRFGHNVMTAQKRQRWTVMIVRLLGTLAVAVVVILIGIKVMLPGNDPDVISLPAMLLMLACFALMYRPVARVWKWPADREAAAQAARRVYAYLDRIPEVGQAVGAKFLQPLSESIRFESVSYQSEKHTPLLDRLDLKIPAGTVTALVSFNPLSCRALAYMLPRFIEPQSGRLLIDGEDIAWVTLESLRAEVICVGGTDPFFAGTVMENISCGNNKYSLQAVTEAAKQSHADHFIRRLENGYETMLGEHGETLDAGQAFRLGLARAVLRNPALMIIEEPKSPLDEDTKSMLDDTYSRIARDRTVLFLPTRLSTVRKADEVVFLNDGQLNAFGTHAELVKKSPLYRHWEYMRFNEFREVAHSETA